MKVVSYDRCSPHLGIITLNDPENLNAMSELMADEFAATVRGIAADRGTLRALILTGAGRAFSAGGDLEMLRRKTELSGEENRRRMEHFYHSFLSILDLGIPAIAAINGAAVGAGLCLACACDIRIASAEAKLGFTFVKLGLHPGMGATYFLPRVLGPARATELLLTGRIIKSGDALAFGLVNEIVEPHSVVDRAKAVALEIAACGPSAISDLLRTIRGEGEGLKLALAREAAAQAKSYASAEFKEGVTAAIEKRTAAF